MRCAALPGGGGDRRKPPQFAEVWIGFGRIRRFCQFVWWRLGRGRTAGRRGRSPRELVKSWDTNLPRSPDGSSEVRVLPGPSSRSSAQPLLLLFGGRRDLGPGPRLPHCSPHAEGGVSSPRATLLLFVSMKKGRLSSDGRWSGSSRQFAVWSGAHVSMASSSGGPGEIGCFALGRKSKRAVRPPDEKRRLSERTPHCE
jgi:hypothetical protein